MAVGNYARTTRTPGRRTSTDLLKRTTYPSGPSSGGHAVAKLHAHDSSSSADVIILCGRHHPLRTSHHPLRTSSSSADVIILCGRHHPLRTSSSAAGSPMRPTPGDILIRKTAYMSSARMRSLDLLHSRICPGSAHMRCRFCMRSSRDPRSSTIGSDEYRLRSKL